MERIRVVQSSRSRHGRRFEPTHERTLDSMAEDALARLPGAHNGVLAIREMTGPIGIPDLTAIVGGSDKIAERLRSSVPPLLNEVDAALVAMLTPRIGREIAAVAAALDWPVTTVGRRVPALIRVGAIERLASGALVRAPELRPAGTIYAIEQKLASPQAALHQARSYASWADAYVLVLGKTGPQSLANIRSAVSVDGGGLVVDGHWAARPRVRRLAAARRMWASEHFVAALTGV